jgi:hypothetical protein
MDGLSQLSRLRDGSIAKPANGPWLGHYQLGLAKIGYGWRLSRSRAEPWAALFEYLSPFTFQFTWRNNPRFAFHLIYPDNKISLSNQESQLSNLSLLNILLSLLQSDSFSA